MSSIKEPWINLGIYAGQINDIAIDPCNPLKIIVGSCSGDSLFISEDGGENWNGVLTGYENSAFDSELTFRNKVINAIKIAPSPYNEVIWVAHDTWVKKSTDGGKTWMHISNETVQKNCPNCGGEDNDPGFCFSLAINPNNPQIIYVGTGGPQGDVLHGKIYKTEDGGVIWHKLTLPPDPYYNEIFAVIDLAISPFAPDVIWALTFGSLYRSEDGGNSWNWINSFNTCYDIEIKPDDPNTIFIANIFGIAKIYFDQEAKKWQESFVVSSDDPLIFFEQIALTFDPQDSEVLYACCSKFKYTSSTAVESYSPTFARSINGGIDWETNSINYKFQSLEVHPKENNVIFAGESNLGLFKSSDYGHTWTTFNKGINAVRVYDIDINPNNRNHLLAGTNIGVYEKKGNKDWSLISKFNESMSYSVVAFHPQKSQIYYTLIPGYFAKTMDGGINWTSIKLDASGNLNFYPTDIAIHPLNTDPNTTEIFISFFGYNYYSSGIYKSYGEIDKSTDGGNSFIRVLEGKNSQGEQYGFNTVAIDPTDPNHIFAGGGTYKTPEANGELWESFDGGVNWIRTGLQDVVINRLIINPNDPNIMYAGCGPSSGVDIPLYKSANGGKTFRPSFSGMREKWIPLYSIWGITSNELFIAGEMGDIFHYNDDIWTPMNSNIRKTLSSLWGTLPNDIFVVGKEGTILHYIDTWSAMHSSTIKDLSGVWGFSSTNVFAVGAQGTILHYEGKDSTWTPMNSPSKEDLWDVWGISSSSIYAVGSHGAILHYDSIWSKMESYTEENLYGIWGTSTSNIYAVGSHGAILHYDGIWSKMESTTTTVSFNKIWGSSLTDIFVVGDAATILHYDGTSWTKMNIDSTAENLLDIWGYSRSDIYVTGDKGSILHYNGSDWSSIKSWWISGNSVIDLEFHSQNKNIIYAATPTTGIYISPNQGGDWLYLGKPEYYVFAIATSSLYAGTESGLWQCTGTGVITGSVKDCYQSPIPNAVIFNDLFVKTISIKGEFMMISPAGICNVTAIADGYNNLTQNDVPVYGGDVSWVNFSMQNGLSSTFPPPPLVIDGNNKGNCFIAAIFSDCQ